MRCNPLDTSGIICDFCGKPDITNVYFTKPFQLGDFMRTNFASCKSCAKSIDNRNITALANRAVRTLPQDIKRQAKEHFRGIYRTFFINLITRRKITPADIFDLQTARATAQHLKCQVRAGHPTLGECSDIAMLEVATGAQESPMLHAADASYTLPEDAEWRASCVVCATGVLGLEVAEDIVGHPAIRTMGSRRRNPVHETRLLGSLVLGIWGGGDENEALQASRVAARQIANSTLIDLADIRRIFLAAQTKASGQPGSDLKLKGIWESAIEQNDAFADISYDKLMGRAAPKPKPRPRSKPKPTASKKRPARKKTARKKTYTRRRRTGNCQICGNDSRGKPLCRKHYYEAIGKPFIEICEHPGCSQPSRGQPLCREHYYGGRGRRRRPRRPRTNPMSKKKHDTLWTNFIMNMEEIGTDNAEQLVNLVEKCDPTHNAKYAPWIGKQVIKRNIVLPADIDDINLVLTEFDNKKHLLPVEFRDIHRYKTPGDLYAAMEQFVGSVTGRSPIRDFILSMQRRSVPGMQLLKPHIKGDVTYDVIKITKAQAAHDLAQGTAWCIKDQAMARSYLQHSPMYLIAKDKEPYALIYQKEERGYYLEGVRTTTEIRDNYDRVLTADRLDPIKSIVRRFTTIPEVDPSSPSYIKQYEDLVEYQEQALGEAEASKRFKAKKKRYEAYVERERFLEAPFEAEEEEEEYLDDEDEYDPDDIEFWAW